MLRDTFHKRSGTTDRGKEYEDVMVANVILKMVNNDSLNDFKITSNDKEFGDFDDIVIEAKFEEMYKTWALQLKHNTKNKMLNPVSLLGEKGDFSVKKYYLNYKQTRAEKLILFTNRKFECSPSTEPLAGEDLKIKIISCDSDELINTNSERCYKFVNTNDKDRNSSNLEDYKEFFDRFYLYANQANVEEIKKETYIKFQKLFLCEQSSAKKYLQFIEEWSFREGKKTSLNKIFMKKVISLEVFSPFIKPLRPRSTNAEKCKLLAEAISYFDITIFDEKFAEIVQTIWYHVKEISIDVNKKEIIKTNYQVSSDAEILWLMEKCPLILESNESVIKAIQFCKSKKIILLGKYKELFQFKIFTNLADLFICESDSYKKITTKFTCRFQGKSVSIEFLIEQNVKVRNLLTPNELIQMLDDSFSIGGEKELIPIPCINRFLSTNIIDFDLLHLLDKDTLVVISGVKTVQTLYKYLDHCRIIKVEDVSVTMQECQPFEKEVYISHRLLFKSEIMELCERKSQRRFHHFRLKNEILEWLSSEGPIDDLMKHRQEIYTLKESEFYNLDDETNLVKILIADPGMGKSVFLRNLKNNIPANYWVLLIQSNDLDLLHSSELSNFFQHILQLQSSQDQQFLKLWLECEQVVFLWDGLDEYNANTLTLVLNIIDQLAKKRFPQWITCRRHLKHTLEIKFGVLAHSINQFNEHQQTYYIKKRLNTILLDDLLEKAVDKINMNISSIKNNDILGIPLQIFMLTELLRHNPIEFLDQLCDNFSIADLYDHFIDGKFNLYFREKAEIRSPNNVAKGILEKHKNVRVEMYEIVALKVHFGEDFIESIRLNCDDFLETIQNDGDYCGLIIAVSKSPTFVHNSFGEYFAALYLSKNFKHLPNLRKIIFEEKHSNIRFLFDLLLAQESPTHVAVLYKNIDALKKCNLNVKDKAGRNPLHLAASWGRRFPLLETTRQQDDIFIIDENKALKKCNLNVKDKAGRNPLHLAASWGRRFLLRFKTTRQQDDIFIIDEDKALSVKDESDKYKEVVGYLSEKCDCEELDDLFGMNSLAYADICLCLYPLIILTAKIHCNLEIFHNFSDIPSILYYCVKFGYMDLVDSIKEIPFIKTKTNRSLLHLAVDFDQCIWLKKIIKNQQYSKILNENDKEGKIESVLSTNDLKYLVRLIQKGAYTGHMLGMVSKWFNPLMKDYLPKFQQIIQELIDSGKVDLNSAITDNPRFIVPCIRKNHEIVEILSKFSGANLNFYSNILGNNRLHYAAARGNAEMLQNLHKNQVLINQINKSGYQPIHIAAEDGYHEIVKYLIEQGADCNARTLNGVSLLLISCINDDERVCRVLLDFGANLNESSFLNLTPLHVAAQEGHEKIVKLLLEYDANINATDAVGRTPFDLASAKGNIKIVRILENYKAK